MHFPFSFIIFQLSLCKVFSILVPQNNKRLAIKKTTSPFFCRSYTKRFTAIVTLDFGWRDRQRADDMSEDDWEWINNVQCVLKVLQCITETVLTQTLITHIGHWHNRSDQIIIEAISNCSGGAWDRGWSLLAGGSPQPGAIQGVILFSASWGSVFWGL